MSNIVSDSGNPQMLIASSKKGITGDYYPYLFCFLYFFFKCLLREIRFWSG